MRPIPTPRSGASVAATLGAISLLVLSGAHVLASSGAPGPSPSAPILETQAWLDDALPAAAEPGTSLRLGALLWDPGLGAPVPAPSTFFRLYPAIGDAGPVERPASSDWPGHIVATVIVPEGGVGRLEVGVQGSSCGGDGCARSDALYDLRGVGPPANGALPRIATVTIEPALPTSVAGVAVPVDLLLRPKVAWPGFQGPGRLVLVVREPRGEPLADAPAPLVDAAGGRYRASLVLPAEGDYVLQAAATEAASPEDTFDASTVMIKALPSTDAPPSAAVPAPEPANDVGGLLLAGVAIAATVLAGGLIYLGVRERS